MKNKFKDKVAIVTGGASGIGRSLCEDLCAMGAIVVAADINKSGADKTVEAVSACGGEACSSCVDVTTEKDIQRLIDETVKKYGRIDYMFNNAGIAIHGEVRDIDTDHWRKIIDVNLMGILYGTLIAYKQMVKQGFGHIVNTSSVLGLVGMGLNALYATTKFAIVGLSTSLRSEGKGLGVKVSVVCPGFIQTNLYDSATIVKADNKEFYGEVPFKRIDVKTASKKILKGVARNKSIVVFPMSAKLMWWAIRSNPDALDMAAAYSMKKFRAIRKDV
ncbi:MAG: SDR family oxidoreductase [Spirochaetes bacterium]|jgi:NAD(P)-dependent dehydrogenase (short-subunit alcohol dehydrogenase family)|nr:SDR family oxidoreductase [Spirochaetota bacterium]